MKRKLLAGFIAVICAFCLFSFAACGLVGKPDAQPKVKNLSAPKNVNFNKSTYTLSWDAVADTKDYVCYGYEIDYNGSYYKTEQTSYKFTFLKEQNTFKVRALAYEYGVVSVSFDWSATVTYNLTQQPDDGNEPAPEVSLYDKVNMVLNKTAKENDLELLRVIGISYANVEGNVVGTHIIFQTICIENDIIQNFEFFYKFKGYDNIAQMLENIDTAGSATVGNLKTVNFNSAEALVQSKSYDGHMQELADDGYTISVIDGCAREGTKIGTKFRFEIVGTFKAERGGEVKYFTGIYRAEMHASSEAVNNYIHSVQNANSSSRTIKETSFVLHESNTTLAYIQALAELIES